MSDSLQPHESQHSRPPCPSPTPGLYSNSCPSSRWCHTAISSSVIPFSSFPQSLPASETFLMCQLFAWGGQSIGVSASTSVLPRRDQDWSPLGWTGWISLQSKELSSLLQHHSSDYRYSNTILVTQFKKIYLYNQKKHKYYTKSVFPSFLLWVKQLENMDQHKVQWWRKDFCLGPKNNSIIAKAKASA